jgi:hypothetical protein
MTIETDFSDCIKSLTTNRCYPDVAPHSPTLPYTVYQQVGGEAESFLEGGTVPKRNARMQVASWAATRLAAAALARSVEDALVASTTLRATPLGAMTADYDEETRRFGARQDFSVWY